MRIGRLSQKCLKGVVAMMNLRTKMSRAGLRSLVHHHPSTNLALPGSLKMWTWLAGVELLKNASEEG
jgi:hypothetical protein